MIMFDPPHPGEVLKEEYLEVLKLSVTELAERLGVSRKNLSSILNERTGISAEMAIRLSKAFSTSPELWMGLQMQFELSQAMKGEEHISVEPVEM